MMTCFQILSPLQSYSIFISSCLGRVLASKHWFIPSVHKGSTIIPVIQLQSQVYLFRMHGWFNNALSCIPSQHTHLLDFTLGTQCKFPHAHSKLHAAVFFKHISGNSNTKLPFFAGNTLHIILQPQAMAKSGSELPSATGLSSVWLINY